MQQRKTQTRYDAFYDSSDFSHFRHELQYIRFLVSHLSPQQQPSEWIADVGCGTGYYTSLFRTLGLNTCGIDVSSVATTQRELSSGIPTSTSALQTLPSYLSNPKRSLWYSVTDYLSSMPH